MMSAEMICGVAPLAAILRMAEKYPVFPCRRHAETVTSRGRPETRKPKSPLTERGFLDASRDPDRIRAWWTRWPEALVGVPTGQGTGLIVVDYDHGKVDQAAQEWVAEHSNHLLATKVHETLNGGRHYVYAAPPGKKYGSSTNLMLGGERRAGIDLRGEGGYIIWWPIHGGNQTNVIMPLPAGLIDEYRVELRELPPLPKGSPEKWSRDRARACDALAYVDPSGYDEWLRVGMALHLASGGSDDGFQLWHAWSSGGLTGDTPRTYGGVEVCREKWASFLHDKARGGTATLGTVFHLAKSGGWQSPAGVPAEAGPPDVELPPDEVYAAELEDIEARQADISPFVADTSAGPPLKSHAIDWTELAGREPPARDWRIAHWMGTGPMLLSGVGGIGKSLLAQTMATALALGRNYVDQVAAPQTVLMWSCEDDRDEIWRRQLAICRMFGVPLESLAGKLVIEPRLGRANALFGLAFGQPTWTTLREELVQQVNDYRATVLFLDNIGQVFGGNENDRHHVTTFVNGITGITEWPLSTVLLGHPAKAIGSEFSGSTAWENAVRMRWFLGTTLPDQPEAATAEDGVRYLAKRKSNYSTHDWRRLVYRDGSLEPDAPLPGPSSYAAQARQDDARRCALSALRKLVDRQIRTTGARNSPDYLPRKIVEMKLAEDYSQRELAEAMNALLMDGRIVTGKVGTYPNRTAMTGLIEAEKVCTK
jgi:RecA-family ATPase